MSDENASERALDESIERLIRVYDKGAVRNRANALTKPRRGRRPLGHWKMLAPELVELATNWLSGTEQRKNYTIAKRVAGNHPGQSKASTFRQLQDKLGNERPVRVLEFALLLTGVDGERRKQANLPTTDYPFSAHFRVLDALVALEPAWAELLRQDLLTLARYRAINGEPDPAMTWSAVRVVAHPSRGLLGTVQPRPG